jgi:hypothetical protein
MEPGMKILTTAQVKHLQDVAKEHGFARQLPDDVMCRLHRDKFHLAKVTYFGANRELTVAGDPAHHRVELALSLAGSRAKRRAMLDVTPGDWNQLPDAEAVRAAVRAEEEAKA